MTANAAASSSQSASSGLKAYKVGDSDTRPWGHYVVTGVGIEAGDREYCEKRITVQPGKILSLQSHTLRAELWRVEEGVLTVILDGQRITLRAGESIDIPLRGIHCMANLDNAPCTVYEKQTGICREEDIIRYLDAYGRATESFTEDAVTASIALYRAILSDIEKG